MAHDDFELPDDLTPEELRELARLDEQDRAEQEARDAEIDAVVAESPFGGFRPGLDGAKEAKAAFERLADHRQRHIGKPSDNRAKLPKGWEPFVLWCSMGRERTYTAVAEHYGVHPSVVTRRAKRDRWSEILTEQIEPRVSELLVEDIAESVADFERRYLSAAQRAMERAVKALEVLPVSTIEEARKLLEASHKIEQSIRAPKVDRKEVKVEAVLTQRFEQLVVGAVPQAKQLAAPRKRIEVEIPSIDDYLGQAKDAEVEGADDE